MRWTQTVLLTRAPACGRRSRVVLTPRRRRQVGGGNSADDGDKKARSPGRARRKPLKPLRAGMPGETGATVVTNSCASYTLRTRLRVHWAPGIPRALVWAKRHAQLGRIVPREGGRTSTHNVVPANAGTHHDRHWRLRESRRRVRRSFSEGGTASLKTSDTAYGSRLKAGTISLRYVGRVSLA
jgi:hypothetical protein